MKSYSYSYTPSEKISMQGDLRKLQRYTNNGYRVVAGSNGSSVLAKSAYGVIFEKKDGKIIASKYANNFIRDYYDRSRITEKAYINLVSDLNAGRVKFVELY